MGQRYFIPKKWTLGQTCQSAKSSTMKMGGNRCNLLKTLRVEESSLIWIQLLPSVRFAFRHNWEEYSQGHSFQDEIPGPGCQNKTKTLMHWTNPYLNYEGNPKERKHGPSKFTWINLHNMSSNSTWNSQKLINTSSSKLLIRVQQKMLRIRHIPNDIGK